MEVQPLTDEQAVTIAGTLGISLLINYQRLMPPHKLVARKVKAVENAIVDLFRSTGQQVDTEVLKHILKCWDEAVLAAGDVPGGEV